MERLRGDVQSRTLRTGCAALGVAAVISLTSAGSARAQAPSPSASPPNATATPTTEAASAPEIVAARELFREGTEDADSGRFAAGLEKFKRVAAVKETAAVRFNIARCEEALGKTGTALADFELAAREGGTDAKAGDVAKLAADRADALRPRVPRLTVVPPSSPPEGMAVSLDGGKLASATLAIGLPVDPGPHVVDATAPGRSPFHTQLTVGAGETKQVELVLALQDGAKALDKPTGAKTDEPTSSNQPTWGWVTIAAGGALVLGSGVFLVLQRNAISSVNADCPNQRCPTSLEPSVENDESSARTYQGASIGLLAAGALALGAGAVLLATAPKSATPALTVTAGAPGAPAGLLLRGSF